jgi:hypothetical protein
MSAGSKKTNRWMSLSQINENENRKNVLQRDKGDDSENFAIMEGAGVSLSLQSENPGLGKTAHTDYLSRLKDLIECERNLSWFIEPSVKEIDVGFWPVIRETIDWNEGKVVLNHGRDSFNTAVVSPVAIYNRTQLRRNVHQQSRLYSRRCDTRHSPHVGHGTE